MSTTVKLPNNATATLRDASELSNKDIKLLQRSGRVAATAAVKMQDSGYKEDDPESWAKALFSLSDDELDQIDLYQRACVIKRLESWTVKNPDGSDRPIPVTEDDVDDLPRPIFEPLTTAAADIKLGDDFGMDGATDPKVGIAAFASSDPPSAEAPS